MNFADENWEDFRERVLGNAYMIWHDGGIDEYAAAKALEKEDPAHVKDMLERGLLLEDYVAVEGIKLMKGDEWVSLVEKTLETSRFRLRIELAQYLQARFPERDYSRYVVDVLQRSPAAFRVDAAVALRNFSVPEVLDYLLESVRHDPEFLVRFNAGASYLILRKIEPVSFYEHETIFKLIKEDAPAEDLAKAADLLKAL